MWWLLIVVWFYLGGAGCGDPPLVQVPLTCPARLNDFHWAYVCGPGPGFDCVNIPPNEGVDCEFTGTEDTTVPPRWLYDYRTVEGKAWAYTEIRDVGLQGEESISATTDMWREFAQEPGRTYHLSLAHLGDGGAAVQLWCDGEKRLSFDTWAGGPMSFVATDEACYVRLVSGCESFAVPEVECEDTLTLLTSP